MSKTTAQHIALTGLTKKYPEEYRELYEKKRDELKRNKSIFHRRVYPLAQHYAKTELRNRYLAQYNVLREAAIIAGYRAGHAKKKIREAVH